MSDYSKALKLDPAHVSAFYQRGAIYKEQKQYQEAMNDWRKAVSYGYRKPEFLHEMQQLVKLMAK